MGVSQLQYFEPVMLDTEILDDMCTRMGYAKAESAISAAMEDLAVLLQYSTTLLKNGETDTLAVTARQIEAVARRIGMATLSRVAGSVAQLCHRRDEAALAACAQRLRRIGEQSLIAIWDREDLSI
ncbi:MAG: hypothetical protein AAGP08_06355 [Pseudomonadota bacterium]